MSALSLCLIEVMAFMNVLALFLTILVIIGKELSNGVQTAIYAGCLALFTVIFVSIRYAYNRIYSDFKKTMVVLMLSIVFLCNALAVPIWRLVVDPN